MLTGLRPNLTHMRRKSYEEGDMKTGQELPKRNSHRANLTNTTHVNSTTLAEKASKVQKVIKKIFTAALTGKETCGSMPGILCVLDIIQNSEVGVDPRTLKQMTGYHEQKIHKILYKLFKHGEIRIEGGGLYAGVKKYSSIPAMN
jgi:hypothetical protein